MNLQQHFLDLWGREQRRVATLKRFAHGVWLAQTPRGSYVRLSGQGEADSLVFYDAKTLRIISPAPNITVWHELEV